MMKKKKLGLEALTKKASEAAESSPTLAERLSHATKTLASQPTGHHPEASVLDSGIANLEQVIADDGGRRLVTFARVNIDLVDPNPYNARKIYRAEKINELATSIAKSGQLVPCIGTYRNGRCITVAGHYRWKAIKAAGIGAVDFMIHENLSDRELYILSFKENDERSDQSPLDNALVWQGLIEYGLYANESAIAEDIGQSLPNVNKTMAILKLSEPILEIVKEQPENFALSALYELVLLEKAAGQSIALTMAKKIGAGEAGRKECTDMRAKYESKKERKPKESSRQYKIKGEDGNIGVLKDWDSGKVAFEIQIHDPRKRIELVDELKKRFGLNE